MLAFTSAIEALRLANAVVGYRAYDWHIVRVGGEPLS
jgi:transcriptional regulator GlxA family with amidase domain